MEIVALVVGATGIAGRGVSEELVRVGARLYGVSRHPEGLLPGVTHVAADLEDPASVVRTLSRLAPTHVYLTVWARRPTEEKNIKVNAGMVRGVLDALAPARSVKHVALVTGLRHYVGPAGLLPQTPVREEQPRLDVPNFYYDQEDEVYAAARRDGFTWSVHRPHTIIGKAIGNAMNMGATLATYASLCEELGRPFKFPGSAGQWNGLSDVTDARVLGKQLVWASTTDIAKNEAYNIANGDIFRWSWLWPRLAKWFGVAWEGFERAPVPLEGQMTNDAKIWKEMSAKYGLVEPDLWRVASPWHTDLDMGRPLEVMTDMSRSRKLGFLVYQNTEEALYDLFATLRAEKVIP